MGFELRLPNITGTTEREQLLQIKSYLYQLALQLQWGLNTIETSSVSNQVPSQASQRVIVQGKAENAEATFNSLKALIIKSADIVDAYYEEINTRLEGTYVAQSDFGIFKEQTSQEITKTSTYTDQKFNDVQEIISDEIDDIKGLYKEDIDGINDQMSKANQDIEALKVAVIESDGYIRSGELYRVNDIPVYGVEVGQTVEVDGEKKFNKFARFIANRLSFYDQNDVEVAYISDYKLFISNAEITSSFKIGGFLDTVMSNGDVVTKWVGGDN